MKCTLVFVCTLQRTRERVCAGTWRRMKWVQRAATQKDTIPQSVSIVGQFVFHFRDPLGSQEKAAQDNKRDESPPINLFEEANFLQRITSTTSTHQNLLPFGLGGCKRGSSKWQFIGQQHTETRTERISCSIAPIGLMKG